MALITWYDRARDDYLYLQKHDKKVLRKVDALIEAIQCDPFSGIGKPERLRYDLMDCWSRRIDRKHRLLYKVDESGDVYILQCRHHYD